MKSRCMQAAAVFLCASSAKATPVDIPYTDSTGTITANIRGCDPTTAQEHPVTSCGVPSGFVLVGGGAQIINDGNPGAVLTASYPDSGLTTWTASSTDHEYVYNHQLQAYSVSLRLKGTSGQFIDPATLRSHMSATSATTPYNGSDLTVVNSSPSPPSGYLLVGGGVRPNPSGGGLLLWQTGEGGQGWQGQVKDLDYPDHGTVTVWQISIAPSIPGFGNLAVGGIASGDAVCTSPYCSEATSLAPNGTFVATCPEALSLFLTQDPGIRGRYLTMVSPFAALSGFPVQGSTGQSKDHVYSDVFSNDSHAGLYVGSVTIRKN